MGMLCWSQAQAETAWKQVSGVYPHLACFNDENECGTGAVVPWADRLWVITYAPHKPYGSSDKLYEITPDLDQIVRPESVGGTPANRMIHRESKQLFIGPYVIDTQRNVRAISPKLMPGRLTGNARHLFDPANRIYYATMEEGFYEVDVHTLNVTQLFADNQKQLHGRSKPTFTGPVANLPGYHGKGLYSGQARLVYANNGESSPEARHRPDIPSGCLAEWDGKADAWRIVRRNQFTEVTGPGGIHGNPKPDTDPLWSIGWDHRSLILMLLDAGKWHAYRLPKAAHTYDGAHGWNTEWPRIRDVGEKDLLMTMHGMFWRFPKTFSAAHSDGIAPRSTYLKVVGDFCRWNDRLVFGCDDAAKSEFLNKRRAKGTIAGPGQSQSNLWFVEPAMIDRLGPPIGRGAVWLNESVRAQTPSEPYLLAGFERRGLHLTHGNETPVTFALEVDRRGNGKWTEFRTVSVPAKGYRWISFARNEPGVWIRLRADRDCPHVTALFHYADIDDRSTNPDPIFDGLAGTGDTSVTGGIIRARGANLRTLGMVAVGPRGESIGYYELDARLELKRVDDPTARDWLIKNAAIPSGILQVDTASAIYVDDDARPWRLPKTDSAFDRPGPLGDERIDREVVTERDLFNCHGTFYELPARNAGGFAKIRPIATHNRRIKDYCSYRGLLVLSGIADGAPAGNPHIIRSNDGKAALWVGVVEDLWKLGKPVGHGGPWKQTAVQAGRPSNPYLMTGYDKKSLTLINHSKDPLTIRAEVDLAGTGLWCVYESFKLSAGQTTTHQFPEDYNAYWIRFITTTDATVTAQLTYR
ncbi:MAG: hypothetical protein JXQ73_03305 [Phycisphaerae bacterium]|nr:hypothetical protein [Phycisphaerae bacterium]